MDLNYMGRRKRQDLLSKLGAWRPWKGLNGRRKAESGAEKNVQLNKINKNKNE